MAESAQNIGSPSGPAEKKIQLRQEVYEQQWTIPDWDTIQRSEDAIKSHNFEFKTGRNTGVHTKWKMGFTFKVPPTKFFAYWQLIEAKGFPDQMVQVLTDCTPLKGDSTIFHTPSKNKLMSLGEILQGPHDLAFNSNGWRQWMNPNGELVFKLKLTIMEPDVLGLRMKLFKEAHVVQVCKNFASLLGDERTADLKIITSDEKQLLAHKVILKAQCPVFESMFRSDFFENQTGIVNVEDLNAKTMGIFLHMFYSGELLSSWKDPDTVVEFTYAAGKYQLTDVLKLLDDVLGVRDEEDASYTDVQLLDLAQKLNLKTAEKELLERIKRGMAKITSGEKFFKLCGIGMDK